MKSRYNESEKMCVHTGMRRKRDMEIARDRYLMRLVERKGNGLIKVEENHLMENVIYNEFLSR